MPLGSFLEPLGRLLGASWELLGRLSALKGVSKEGRTRAQHGPNKSPPWGPKKLPREKAESGIRKSTCFNGVPPALLRLSGGPKANLWLFPYSGEPAVNLPRFLCSSGPAVHLSHVSSFGGFTMNLSLFPWFAGS